MGNCQTNDAAAVVLQHTDGHAERLFWPTTADVIMRNHPDHYVAHITLSRDRRKPSATSAADYSGGSPSVRLTKIRLLKHKEMLLIGEVYRLMTSEEVTKELRARKQQQVEIQQHILQLLELHNQRVQNRASIEDSTVSGSQLIDQAARKMRNSRTWRPSLESISEIVS